MKFLGCLTGLMSELEPLTLGEWVKETLASLFLNDDKSPEEISISEGRHTNV